MRILLDMDEVLTDFVGAVCTTWRVEQALLLENWPAGEWDIIPPLGRALRRAGRCTNPVMTPNEFWHGISGQEGFWTEMRPLPWFYPLVDLISSFTDDWHIVSSPSACNSSYSGKVKWLKREFGSGFDRFCLTPHKHLFAQPGVILIDDRDSNIARFMHGPDGKVTGGLGIVFPRHHNSLHGLDSMAYTEMALVTAVEFSRSEPCV